jgi:hypothetical protein
MVIYLFAVLLNTIYAMSTSIYRMVDSSPLGAYRVPERLRSSTMSYMRKRVDGSSLPSTVGAAAGGGVCGRHVLPA